jgi:hypothetical protein
MNPCSHRKILAESAAVGLALAAFLLPVAALGGTVTAPTRDNLNSAVASGSLVTTFTVGGVNFAYNANAVTANRANTVLQGSSPSGFTSGIEALVNDILGVTNTQRENLASVLAGLVQSRVDAFVLPSGMTFIDGGGGTRTRNETVNFNNFNYTRWLTTTSGFGAENLHFKDVTVNYGTTLTGAGGVVNGLIGNVSNNTGNTSFGDFTGNAFTGIGITFTGTRDTQYLAGGGVIGLRATGELGAPEASVSTGAITGNLFKGISVFTTGPSNNQAYIEGGGIIGLDAASSPLPTPGYAYIPSLSGNLFTGIKVQSDDILLGGGLVGLNNNSQVNDPGSTYVRLDDAVGNVFGNGYLDGVNSDIYVKTGYSLRGGGVIGLNALSNAYVDLVNLEKNSFAGIYVETGSYLRGGGIVGLQSNDGSADKPDLCPNGCEVDPVAAILQSAHENLFLNMAVKVGTNSGSGGYLEGGGIIGVRSNAGMASIYDLTGNIFKGLALTVENNGGGKYLDGGGIVGVSSQLDANIETVASNYFDGIVVDVVGELRGGGIVGASSKKLTDMDTVTNNEFKASNVKVGGNLYGGGVVGANTWDPGVGSSYAIIRYLRDNKFTGLNVKVGDDNNDSSSIVGGIEGGGIVGARTVADGGRAGFETVSRNSFDGSIVDADYLSGGGILGLSATGANGAAYIGEMTSNRFLGAQVSIDGDIRGGGVIGMNATGLAGVDRRITGSRFEDTKITAGGDIEGGGVLGAHSDGGNAYIGEISGSNIFQRAEIKAGGDIEGGGIVGVSSPGTAGIENVDGNEFDDLEVEVAGDLHGGGVLGASSEEATELSNVANNEFKASTVTVDGDLQGGGIVGARTAGSGGTAGVSTVSGNHFIDLTIGANSLSGGGLLGLSASGTAQIDDEVTGNEFLGAQVNIAGAIDGGGVLGVHSDNGIAYINEIRDGNIFQGANITANTIDGGGVVGASSETLTVLNNVANNEFKASNVYVGGDLQGGGIVGANTRGLGSNAIITTLSNNRFTGLSVKVGDADNDSTSIVGGIEGGGIVGARTAANGGTASFVAVSGNRFTDLTVDADRLSGGGILGLSAGTNADAAIGAVTGNEFLGAQVSIDSAIQGGGVIGVNSTAGISGVQSITGNRFDSSANAGTKVEAQSLQGGGVVGVNAGSGDALILGVADNRFLGAQVSIDSAIQGGGIIGTNTTAGISGMESITGNLFDSSASDRTKVEAQSLQGGGVVGVNAGSGSALILVGLVDNRFIKPEVSINSAIDGGGVLGVRSDGGTAYIGEITRSRFEGAEITAGTYINGGGLIGVTGDMAATGPYIGIGMIDKSVFTGNRVTAENGQIMGGAVYSYSLANGMIIRDSVFTDNLFTSAISNSGQYNGPAPGAKVYGTVAVDTGMDLGGDSHSLMLTATPGNSTVFRNNRIVENGSERYNALYFGAIPEMETDGSGHIAVGADNAEADAMLTIAPQTGGVVALYDPIEVNQNNGKTFHMAVQGDGGDFLWGGDNKFATNGTPGELNFFSGSRTTLLQGMSLDAPDHDLSLLSGGRINVMGWGWNATHTARTNANELTLNRAEFHGQLHFDLQDGGAEVNEEGTALLNITTPLGTHTNISGATVSLSDFAAGPALKAGDMFYLIDTNDDDQIEGDPANSLAYARQGMTRGYYFTIDSDTSDDASSQPNTNRYLVARLQGGPVPAHEARVLVEGRAASLALLGQSADWLADHSYQQADLALRRGENRALFGGVDGAWMHVDTGSRVKFRSNMMLLGVAGKNERADSSFLYGGYLEAGYAHYDIHGKFGRPEHPDMKGRGNLRYYGLGLMARQRWDNGFRLEGSLRGGRVENRFHSSDLSDPVSGAAKYTLRVPYFGAHLGMGYEWQINERSTLDLLARYFWTRQNGKTITLPTDERVTFRRDDSQRLRIGTRYTRAKNRDRAWYVGVAGEYEFDHRSRAKADGDYFGMPHPKGYTTVGEIGMIIHSRDNDRFSAEFGVQGYAGKREGISGGFRLDWRF